MTAGATVSGVVVGGFCPAAGRAGFVGDGFDLVVRVDDEFTVAFGVLDLDPDRALERLRFADDEGQGVVAEVLQGFPGRDDAGVARDDDLGGAVVADDGLDAGKGHELALVQYPSACSLRCEKGKGVGV